MYVHILSYSPRILCHTSKKLSFLELNNKFASLVEILENFLLNPGERYKEGHQLVTGESFEVVEASLFEVALADGLTYLKELLSVRNKFRLELTDGFLNLRFFLLETFLKEDFELVESGDVLLKLVLELYVLFLE
jgi:hypothetical protein